MENKTNISQIYNIERYNEKLNLKNLKDEARKIKRKNISKLNKKKFYKNLIFQIFPILEWVTSYKLKSYLIPDVFAGLIVGIMNIPQGLFNIIRILYDKMIVFD